MWHCNQQNLFIMQTCTSRVHFLYAQIVKKWTHSSFISLRCKCTPEDSLIPYETIHIALVVLNMESSHRTYQ